LWLFAALVAVGSGCSLQRGTAEDVGHRFTTMDAVLEQRTSLVIKFHAQDADLGKIQL